MEITEIRRENLRRWVAEHGTPQREKSLFSQLKSNGSFGERVARRLEREYGMGEGFLDAQPMERAPTEADKETQLLLVYRLAADADKVFLMSVATAIKNRMIVEGTWKEPQLGTGS
jgi:hypothetical protein